MPELPEVETVVRALQPILTGQTIVKVTLRRENLRIPFAPDFAQRLAGEDVIAVERRAKYIMIKLRSGTILLVHLGMTGRFSVVSQEKSQGLAEFYYGSDQGEAGSGPHDHVIFSLNNGTRLVFSDPRRFGLMELIATSDHDTHHRLSSLGVEPLGNHFTAAYLAEKFQGKTAPLKAALLDQRIIAGLGNIYVSEALFRSRLSPLRQAGTLGHGKKPDPRLEELVRHIRDILQEAIRAGGSTLKDFTSADGEEGQYQQQFAVYSRANEPCPQPRCGGTISRIVQSGRSTFYCPTCQK